MVVSRQESKAGAARPPGRSGEAGSQVPVSDGEPGTCDRLPGLRSNGLENISILPT